jgi:hypothetical protein
MINPSAIEARCDALEPVLDARARRPFAASEARAAGKAITVPDREMDAINLIRDEFHGEWDYKVRPRTGRDRAL